MEGISRVDDFSYRLELGYIGGMRRTARVFVGEEGLAHAAGDGSLRQLAETACLPGGVGEVLAMPDIHRGYGFPIGGVAAFEEGGEGVVSPGGVGYDINCGVRCLVTRLEAGEVRRRAERLAEALFNAVPCGVGAESKLSLGDRELRKVLIRGARWAVEHGAGTEADLEACESGGALGEADPEAVSEKARRRGKSQLGTLGSGNHFLEVQRVAEIRDATIAADWGINETDSVTVMIHCGSRGLGHQICDDYLATLRRSGYKAPNAELAYAPQDSLPGRAYLGAMAAAANYAWANRQRITATVREVFGRLFGLKDVDLPLLYDVAHNIAKFEEHTVDGVRRRLLVHRKGATRAFPAGHPELAPRYRQHGQPVILPGDMGRASYLLVGRPGVMETSFGSISHGAGRLLSRKAAVARLKGRDIVGELARRGVTARWEGRRTLFEEHPEAYKDIDEVVHLCESAGLARAVARLEPLVVVKG